MADLRPIEPLSGDGLLTSLREQIDAQLRKCITCVTVMGNTGEWQTRLDESGHVILVQPETEDPEAGIGCKETFDTVIVSSTQDATSENTWGGTAIGQTVTFSEDDELGNHTITGTGPQEQVDVGDFAHKGAVTVSCREDFGLLAGNAIDIVGDIAGLPHLIKIALAPGEVKGQIAWWDPNLGWILMPGNPNPGQFIYWDDDASVTPSIVDAVDGPVQGDGGAWVYGPTPTANGQVVWWDTDGGVAGQAIWTITAGVGAPPSGDPPYTLTFDGTTVQWTAGNNCPTQSP